MSRKRLRYNSTRQVKNIIRENQTFSAVFGKVAKGMKKESDLSHFNKRRSPSFSEILFSGEMI